MKSAKTTVALATYDIEKVLPENKLTASKFLTELKGGHTQLQNKIKEEIKNVILAPAIAEWQFNCDWNTAKHNDDERTVTLSYTVAGYWLQGAQQEASKTKPFETTFTNLAYVSTDFGNGKTFDAEGDLSLVQVSDLVDGWKTEQYYQDYLKYNIFGTFTSGNKAELSENDIIIKDVKATSTQYQATISYVFTKYWDYSGLVNKESVLITITCNGIGNGFAYR